VSALGPLVIATDPKRLPTEWDTIPAEILAKLQPRNGIYTPEQAKELQRIANGRFFLLRNDGPDGEVKECGRCHRNHMYFTMMCVEVPFCGLGELVGFIKKQRGNDLQYEVIRWGSIEPITYKKAEELVTRIEMRGGRFTGPITYDGSQETLVQVGARGGQRVSQGRFTASHYRQPRYR